MLGLGHDGASVMKAVLLALASIIFLPLSAQPQSVLNFPHVLDPADFATTGFAVVNSSASDATATFSLFGADGSALSTSQQPVRKGGQIAKLGSQLFGASASGWVQVTSATTGIQGFWFAGDLVTFGDGAEPATSASELVLPVIAPSSEIHIANTGTVPETIVMDLLSGDGLDVDERFVQQIPPRGFFKANTAAIFPKADLTQATHMRLKCGCAGNPFAALVVTRNFIAAPSSVVLNAVPVSTSTSVITFPHLVDGAQGNANWKSVVSVTNLSATPNDVTIVFTADNGTTQTVQRTIQPNGTIREMAGDMFGFTTGFQSGWVRVSSASLPITGFLAYAETVGAGVTAVSAQVDAQPNLLFAQIADLPPWWTGLALLNPGQKPASVEIFAMNPDGSLIGNASARFSLAAGSKVAKLLSEWVPATQNRSSDGGFIFVRSDLPLFGIELFFSRSTQILANVPAAKIPPGSYVPPPSR